jgi:hypothetical protein
MEPKLRGIRAEMKIKMRPELELVLRSARAKSPENDARILELLGEGLDWDQVLARGHQHKLMAFVHERFNTLDVAPLTPDQKQKLSALARDLAKNNLGFMGEMLWLHGTFQAAGIPAVPFKGPALAWLGYRNFALRTYVDLDFVVPQRYIPETVALLTSHGFIPQFDPAEAQAGQHGAAPGQYAFAPSGNHKFLELHTERTLRYFSRPLDLAEMNSRMIPLQIGGKTLPSFSVEDLLVMLSVHGAKHFWERLAWVLDIAKLAGVREVDWQLAKGIAAKMESTRVLLLGLCLAHELFDAPLPGLVLEEIVRDRAVGDLASKVYGQYAGLADPGAGVLPRAAFRFHSRDGIAQGLRHTLRLALSPTESDRQTVRLPRWLAPLYIFVRPWRLLREYGSGLKRRE